MKVDVSMTTEKNEFNVSSWWAKTPEFVIESLRKQLEAATAVWPELVSFKIDKLRSRSKAERGARGSDARAAALSPERRSEIASEAAKARWGTQQTPRSVT